ncbi:xylose isomerase [Pantoea piersonii]|uniref:xylose isomerase n=1 Tax=Pantoea piersonii TaxID=2364647 RepID=UPI0022F1786F|nr:xylose isomerase [Pantoea piersonii]WBV24321.1 xylose isomerase [Pantoea piersonii]
MKRGVSLYSYQQSQFFGETDLASQIDEVSNHLHGAKGIEVIDEMSLQYPAPDKAFMQKWYDLIDRNGLQPVALDVGMDVLQFRTHVMSYDECAERLRSDIKLAHSLGFSIVRVLSVVPIEIMIKALPLAEALDIRIGREIHQPMPLEGQNVTEIVEFCEKNQTRHLGLVPDFGIFGTRPSEVMLDWFVRRGAQQESTDVAVKLAELIQQNDAPFKVVDMARHTAGNVRSEFNRFVKTGESTDEFRSCFAAIKEMTEQAVKSPQDIDYTVAAEGLMLSQTSADTLKDLSEHITHIHAKFYNMSLVPGTTDQYRDISIDYASPIAALKEAGFQGYLNSEYEGQRYFHDRGRENMMSEIEQVRRHQEMLTRLISA